MKKIIFLVTFNFILVLFSQATIRIVNNNTGVTANPPYVYTSIETAYSAASSGDTLYLVGSPFNYVFDVTSNLSKSLVYVGPGWFPDRSFVTNTAKLLLNNNANNFGIISSANTFEGIEFVNQNSNLNHVILNSSNISFIRCVFNTKIFFNVNLNNVLFTGCFFADYWGGGSFTYSEHINGNGKILSNVRFENNVFRQPNSGNYKKIINLNNVTFNHNLFYGASQVIFNNSSNLTFSNNIFININLASGFSSCIFSNNLTWNTGGSTTPWLINGNSGNGNIANTDPQLGASVALSDNSATPLSTTASLSDFSASSGPIKNAGTDSKDIGLFFETTGMDNWARSRNSRYPFIYSISISPSSIPQGTPVQITVNARNGN